MREGNGRKYLRTGISINPGDSGEHLAGAAGVEDIDVPVSTALHKPNIVIRP